MKPTHILFFLSLIGIIFSYTGSKVIFNDVLTVTADSYEVIQIGRFPYSTLRVLCSINSEHDQNSTLIEIRILNKDQLSSFSLEDYEGATVFPDKRFFVDEDFDGTIIKDLGFSVNFMVVNNKIRVSESQSDKVLQIRVDLFQPYAYLRLPSLLALGVSFVWIIKTWKS